MKVPNKPHTFSNAIVPFIEGKFTALLLYKYKMLKIVRHFSVGLHPTNDEYRRSLNPTAADYAKIDIPILTVSGYFDGDQPGALRYYQEHLENASKELGGFSFDDSSVLDMDQLQIDWFNWTL